MAISNVNSLQRSYKQKPPPGKTRNVERETGHVLRLEVLFCILNSLLKTIFIYNISARDRPYAQVSNSFSILEFLAQKNSPKLFYFEQFVNSDEFSSCFVHSNPGDFLFLDKFTSTGFINKIYNMEVGISLSESRIPNLQKKEGISWLFRCAKTTSGWWLLQSVEQLGCRWFLSSF